MAQQPQGNSIAWLASMVRAEPQSISVLSVLPKCELLFASLLAAYEGHSRIYFLCLLSRLFEKRDLIAGSLQNDLRSSECASTVAIIEFFFLRLSESYLLFSHYFISSSGNLALVNMHCKLFLCYCSIKYVLVHI